MDGKLVLKIKPYVKKQLLFTNMDQFGSAFGFIRFNNSQTGRAVRPPIIPAR